jgi:HAD superfamily hydrolase (TIGR01509 family)
MAKAVTVIILDLDGTLVDTCDIHYNALNMALEEIGGENYIISRDDHLQTFNGLSTRKKLDILNKTRNLSVDLFEEIFKRKQQLTEIFIKKLVERDIQLEDILTKLKSRGIKVYCATNCIRKIGHLILNCLGIKDLMDKIYTNEDVILPKPDSEMYLRCLEDAKCSVNEAVIFEDSPLGIRAAKSSGCRVIEVSSSSDTKMHLLELYNSVM